MSLETGEKAIICRKYDTLLNQLRPIHAFMKHPYYPNFINFDEYYQTEEEAKHITHSILLSEEIANKIKKDSEEVLEYIKKPGFLPELTTYNRILSQNNTSLEDTILYRNVSDTLILEERPTKDGYIRLSRCYLLYLSKNITYLSEKTLFIPINVYHLLEKIIKKGIEEDKTEGDFLQLLWSEIEKRRIQPETRTTNSNFLSKKDLDQYMYAKYGENYKNSWNYRGIFRLDNRKYDFNTEKQITLTKSFLD